MQLGLPERGSSFACARQIYQRRGFFAGFYPLQALKAKPAEPLVRFFVRDRRGRLVHIAVADVTRLVGADDYVEIHVGNVSYLVHVTLAEFERRLDPAHFRRVHRSVIVNLDKIVACERIDRRLHIQLSDGSRVIASRSGSQDLRKLLV